MLKIDIGYFFMTNKSFITNTRIKKEEICIPTKSITEGIVSETARK